VSLDEIKATFDFYFPGSTGKDRQSKIAVSEKVFGVKSGEAIAALDLATLEWAIQANEKDNLHPLEKACVLFKESLESPKEKPAS